MYAKIGPIVSVENDLRAKAVVLADSLRTLARQDTGHGRNVVLNVLSQFDIALREEDEEALTQFVEQEAPDLFAMYCPPYTSFGERDSCDGPSLGIYPDIEYLTEAARYNDGVISVAAGDEWPSRDDVASDIEYVVEVNDHGNVSLYSFDSRQELWACV